jgi:hypothetical protein
MKKLSVEEVLLIAFWQTEADGPVLAAVGEALQRDAHDHWCHLNLRLAQPSLAKVSARLTAKMPSSSSCPQSLQEKN